MWNRWYALKYRSIIKRLWWDDNFRFYFQRQTNSLGVWIFRLNLVLREQNAQNMRTTTPDGMDPGEQFRFYNLDCSCRRQQRSETVLMVGVRCPPRRCVKKRTNELVKDLFEESRPGGGPCVHLVCPWVLGTGIYFVRSTWDTNQVSEKVCITCVRCSSSSRLTNLDCLVKEFCDSSPVLPCLWYL